MYGSPNEYLMHYGVKGMHWGVRRYQNKDGSYTSKGKKHRASNAKKKIKISSDTKKKLAYAVGAVGIGLGAKSIYDSYKPEIQAEVIKRKGGQDSKGYSKKYEEGITSLIKSYDKEISRYYVDGSHSDNPNTIRNRIDDIHYMSNDAVRKRRNFDESFRLKYDLNKLDTTDGIIFNTNYSSYNKLFNNACDAWDSYAIALENKAFELEQANKVSHADIYGSYLAHHGIKGMHWGIRRYEDSSGHLTPAGKKRYDKYDYSTKSASVSSSKRKTSLSKKVESLGRKAALAGGLALGAYGTAQILKNKKAISDISSQIESKHGHELEGLDPKKRQKILKRVSKEQKYEQDRIEKLRKSKDPKDQKKAESGSRILTDEHISSRINKLKPKNLRTKQPKQSRQQKQTKSTEKKDTNWQWPKVGESKKTSTVTAVKKKPGQASNETVAIRNANRIESLYRKRDGGTSTKTPSKPQATVTRTESREKAERPTKTSKTPQSKISTKTKIKAGKTALSTSKALLTKDYATAIYNTSNTLIEGTNKLIEQFKDHRV